MSVKQAHTFEADVWTTRSVESMIKGRASNKTGAGEMRKREGYTKPNKMNRFSKPDPIDGKSGLTTRQSGAKIAEGSTLESALKK